MNVALMILGAIAVLTTPVLVGLFQGMREIRELVVREVDLSKLTDGEYMGAYHKGRWTYDVAVTVRDHRLVSVVNTNVRINVHADWLDDASGLHTSKVDVISGATLNTKAFGRAMELALSAPLRS